MTNFTEDEAASFAHENDDHLMHDDYVEEGPEPAERTDLDMVVAFTVQVVVPAAEWNRLQDDVLDSGDREYPPTTASDLFCDDIRHELMHAVTSTVLANHTGELRNAPVLVGTPVCRRYTPPANYNPDDEQPF